MIEEFFSLMGQFSVGDLFPSLSLLEGIIGLSRRARRIRNKLDMLFEEIIQAHVQSGESNEGQDNLVDILLCLKNDPSINFEITIDNIKGLLTVSLFFEKIQIIQVTYQMKVWYLELQT